MKTLHEWLAIALTACVLGLSGGGLAAQPSPPADAIRGTKAEVFNRPEFQPGKPAARSWLMRQLLDFLHWLGGLHEVSPILFWLLLIGCLATLCALVALIIYQLWPVFSVGRLSRRAPGDPAAQRIRLSAAYREESDRRAAAGDYTEAVRFLFLALVYRLDERGRVSFHKEYTNREYLELVGDRLHVRDALRVLVDTLDDHWYAQRPCGRAQYEECLEIYNRLVNA